MSPEFGLHSWAILMHSCSVQILSHGASDVGRVRQLNEDFFLVDPELSLYVVCDGMGGHAGGDVASRMTAEILKEHVGRNRALIDLVKRGEEPPSSIATLLSDAIQRASAKVFKLSADDPKKRGMGTTCTAVMVIGDKGIMGHVGDSRLYLCRSGQVYQLSDDHTFVQEAVKRGLLTPEQAKESEHRNIVTRAVGPTQKLVVDTLIFDILPNDTILLCSDGLHGYVDNASELAASLFPEKLEIITSGLIETANQRGGGDNITVLALRAKVAGPEVKAQEARAHRMTAELNALSHIVLFSELDMKELLQVAAAFESKEYAESEVVIHEGEVSETLFVLVSGAARVSRQGEDMAILRAGDHFGDMALLSRRPRSATVRTLKSSRLLTLSRDHFYELLKSNSVIAAKFLWRLAQTLSLRLDDIYIHNEKFKRSTVSFDDDTQICGLFPSPFDGG